MAAAAASEAIVGEVASRLESTLTKRLEVRDATKASRRLFGSAASGVVLDGQSSTTDI